MQLVRSVVRWFDSHAGPAPTHDDLRVDWVRLLPFFALHLACLGVFWVEATPAVLWTALALYLARMFALTAFYHRYFSHKAFRTSRAVQLLFALLGGAAAQRGALWWAAHHRHHHRHSDTEADRHSPEQHGFLWSHFGWFTAPANFRTDVERVPDLARYPELRFLDRFDALPPLLLAAALYLLGGPAHLVWGFCVGTVLLWHVTFCINSLAHRVGRRPYATGDDSRNNLLLALFSMGEGWHNNHHFYPGSARQGFRWWEIDVTWYVLLLLEKLRIVRDLRPLPAWVARERS